MAMVRTQIYLPADLDEKLRKEASARKISKPELIRERIIGMSAPSRDPVARQRFLDRLEEVQRRAGFGPGTGWRFDRNEIYDERLDKLRGTR